jgi:UDPglucose 6-dehydrogenase
MCLVSLSITVPHLPDVLYCHSAYEAAEGIDARVGAVPRARSRPAQAAMTQPVIVNLGNVYRADEMKRASFRYLGVGRAEVK